MRSCGMVFVSGKERFQQFRQSYARLLWRVLVLSAVAWFYLPVGAQASPTFTISLADSGVYRVTYADLVAAGLGTEVPLTSSLALSNAGVPVPLWIADGGDGRFGPGDWFE